MPVVILIHGYKYSPLRDATDPARLIFSPQPQSARIRYTSWPQGLGFGPETLHDGLCIGFAWPAHARDAPRSDGRDRRSAFTRVYDSAAGAGAGLVGLIDMLDGIAPGRAVDILAHSLGARVALRAVRDLGRGTLGQVILMGGAEYTAVAGDSNAALGPGRPQFFNITSRQNDLYDFLFRWFGPVEQRRASPLSSGLGHRFRNWIDLPVAAGRSSPSSGPHPGGALSPLAGT